MAKFCKRICNDTTEWVAENGLNTVNGSRYNLLGGKVKDLCDYLGISQETYYEWGKTQPEFSEAIKKGAERFDAAFPRRLLSAAVRKGMGYDRDGKHYPPDTAMLIFLLTNSLPERWQNRLNAKTDSKVTVEDSTAWLQEVIKKRTDGGKEE